MHPNEPLLVTNVGWNNNVPTYDYTNDFKRLESNAFHLDYLDWKGSTNNPDYLRVQAMDAQAMRQAYEILGVVEPSPEL